jgi:uncharacterized membrane protein HdeD (DUF308 family)
MKSIVLVGFCLSVACPVVGLAATYAASRRHSAGIASRLLPAIPHLLVTSPIPRFTRISFLLGAFSFIAVVNSIHRRLRRRNRRENGWTLVVVLVSGSVYAFTLAGLVAVEVNRVQKRCAANLAGFLTSANVFHFTVDRLPRRASAAVALSRALGAAMAAASVAALALFAASRGRPGGAAYAVSAGAQFLVFALSHAKLALIGAAVFGPRGAGPGAANADPFAYRTA